MKKKIIAAACLAAVMAFTGCANNETSSNNSSTSNSTKSSGTEESSSKSESSTESSSASGESKPEEDSNPEETSAPEKTEKTDWSAVPYADELDFEVEEIDGGIKIINYLGSDTIIKIPETIDGKKVLAISRAVYYENHNSWGNITTYGYRDLSGDEGKPVKPALGDKVTHVNIPEGVTDISHAFYGCENLVEVNIPSSLTTVSQCAFYGCSALSSIDIPNTVTAIDEKAFYRCGIESITIPDSMKEIRGDFISECRNLKEVNLPEKITLLPGSEWDGTVYGTITLDGCRSLTNTDFVKNIIPADNINSLAISYDLCNSLTSITYPDGVDNVGSFNSCINLTEITIPDSVTSVGSSNYFTFAGCENLKKVTLPDSLETIYENAFYECPEDLEIVYKGKTYKANQVPNLLKAVNGN